MSNYLHITPEQTKIELQINDACNMSDRYISIANELPESAAKENFKEEAGLYLDEANVLCVARQVLIAPTIAERDLLLQMKLS